MKMHMEISYSSAQDAIELILPPQTHFLSCFLSIAEDATPQI